jgi:ABC-type multidrug transport system fused ATPase/permease subunit
MRADGPDRYAPPDLGVRETAVRLARVGKEQWRLTALGLSLALAYTILSTIIPLLIARAIDQSIVHHAEPLAPLLAAITAVALVRMGVNFQRRYATARVGVRVEARMRELLFHAYLRFPRGFYDHHATGQVVSRATNDLYPIRYFIGWGLVQGAQSAMMIVAAGIVLGLTDPELALLSAIPLPIIALVAWRFGRLVTPISREVQERKGDVTEAADEAVVGIEMVQAFGREGDIQARFADRAGDVREAVLRQARIESHHLPSLFFLPSLAVAVVLLLGGERVIAGTLTYGQFALFIQLLLQLVWPLEAMGWILNLGQRAIASAGRAFAWIEGVPCLPEAEAPRALPAGGDEGLPVSLRGVHFAYPDGSEVLSGVDLDVEAGEILAVCGPTGSGKSTLLQLVARFYDPDEGEVRLGGVDLRDLSLSTARGDVAVVTQRPVLFSDSLRENLLVGNPDATQEQLEAACDVAGVSAFLDDLPDRWETLIGERGVNLSGGQRQRVALARALLADARVLVLDDPLSAVDTDTELGIVERLRDALDGRTVLLATQRLSTLALAERVAVLVDGRVTEQGEPAELLERDGAFTELFGEESPVL